MVNGRHSGHGSSDQLRAEQLEVAVRDALSPQVRTSTSFLLDRGGYDRLPRYCLWSRQRPYLGASLAGSGPGLVFLICHLLADEPVPTISENIMEDDFDIYKDFNELNKNIMMMTVTAFAKHLLSTVACVLT